MGSSDDLVACVGCMCYLGQCKALDYLVFTECLCLFVCLFLSFFLSLFLSFFSVHQQITKWLHEISYSAGQHLPANVYRIFIVLISTGHVPIPLQAAG